MNTYAVMLSIKPKWCELIASGEKTVEVRKTRPSLIHTPFPCYIYETKGETETPWIDEEGHFDFHGRGMVIGEFMCDLITGLKANNIIQAYYNNTQETCIPDYELVKYANGKMIYYWHISNLVLYENPVSLTKFEKICPYTFDCCACPHYNWIESKCDGRKMIKAPQSWCYVERKFDKHGKSE